MQYEIGQLRAGLSGDQEHMERRLYDDFNIMLNKLERWMALGVVASWQARNIDAKVMIDQFTMHCESKLNQLLQNLAVHMVSSSRLCEVTFINHRYHLIKSEDYDGLFWKWRWSDTLGRGPVLLT